MSKNDFGNVDTCFCSNMNVRCINTAHGDFVCVNDRLILSSVRSFEQAFNLLDELEEIDSTYTKVYEISAFMQWHDFRIAACNLEQLPVGSHMVLDTIKVVKVSDHLVSGIDYSKPVVEDSTCYLGELAIVDQNGSVEEVFFNN